MASTGPRSPEGKQKVSQNARKQGFRSQHVTLTAQQLAGIDACIQFFTADFPHLHQQHLALFIQLGTAWWNLQQFDKLENECYKTTDYEYAVGRLFTLTRYRAHHERLFHQAMGILLTLLAKCTIKANPPEPAPAHNSSHHGTATVMERPHPGAGHFCTIKAKELPETILPIHRRTPRNADRKSNRAASPSLNPYRAFPKPDTPNLIRHRCHRRRPLQRNRRSGRTEPAR